MNKARHEYYRNFIDDIGNDQRKLFKASKSLLNLAEGSTFPPCTDYQVLANEFGEFFVQKIAGIKSMISSTALDHHLAPCLLNWLLMRHFLNSNFYHDLHQIYDKFTDET